jgi:hypothetical protein
VSAQAKQWLSGTISCGVFAAWLGSCSRAQELPHGGQSGTEAGDVIVCRSTEPRSVEPDQIPTLFDRSLSELTRALSVHDVPGLWLATGTRPQLSIELGAAGASETARVGNGRLCASILELDATIRSSDGVLDAQVRAHLGYDGEGMVVLEAPLPALPAAYLGRAAWPRDEEHAAEWAADLETRRVAVAFKGSPPTLFAEYHFDTSPFDATAYVYNGQKMVGVWNTIGQSWVVGPPYPYAPDALLAGACADAQHYQDVYDSAAFTPYASAEAALASSVGSWARCLDPVPSSHAGLQILPDGSWRDFTVEGGELVARFGFEHEGFLEAWDGGRGSYSISLLPFGRRADGQEGTGSSLAAPAGEPALRFDSENGEWPAAVYQRTTLPVRAAPPEYRDGERAGAAACSHTEQGIVPSLQESLALLSGDFVLCSGALRSGATRLHFDASSVQLQREDGSLISQTTFQQNVMNSPNVSLFSTPGDPSSIDWAVVISRRPMKLWIGEGGPVPAVFSALP